MSCIIDFAAPIGQKAGPGRSNDLDMLEVGNGGMSFDQYGKSCEISHITLFSSIRSYTFLNVRPVEEPSDIEKSHFRC